MQATDCPHEDKLDRICDDVCLVKELLTGNGDPEKGLIAKVIKLHERTKALPQLEDGIGKVTLRVEKVEKRLIALCAVAAGGGGIVGNLLSSIF